MKKKILIAPEYAMSDLAESHRMSSIAKAFLDLGHEVYVLGKGRFDYLFKDKRFKTFEIKYDYEWLTDEKFSQIHDLDKYGLSFVSEEELEIFVKEEIKLLNQIKPDAVITGFRPTMNISTKIAKVPLVWVLSAVVSDLYFESDLRTMPYGFSKIIKTMRFFFKIISPKLFLTMLKHLIIMPKWYGAWNKVMKKYKMPKFKSMMSGFRGDFNLMSDAVELFPEFTDIPEYYDFCGPLLPDLKIKKPLVLKNYKKKKNRPVIFFSMGSSGDKEIYKKIIYSFKDKAYDVFAATTSILNKEELEFIPENVFVEKYFPAIELTEMSDLAIIHGGQGTVYTTILGGTPFIGIPMFNEQQWNLENVARNNCGIILPRPGFNTDDLHTAIDEILKNKSYKENMIKLKKLIKKYQTNKKMFPPRIAAEKIIKYLDNKHMSYFDDRGY